VLNLAAAMREEIAIWARTPETDEWALVTGARAAITELDLRGRRTTALLLDPDITHVARVPLAWQSYLAEGRRMVRQSDGQEFVIGPVRDNVGCLTRHVRCYLMCVKEPVTAG
jgi:hypothetical protein